jgi:DNA repair protein RadC
MKNQSIKMWAEDDRPREKMALKGRHSLSNAELLAILIGSGTREKSAVELSQDILAKCNNKLRNLSKQNVHELITTKGIGHAKALTIMAAMELARRRSDENENELQKIMGSSDVYRFFRPILSDLHHEEFHVLLLTRSNGIIGSERISVGGISGTVVDGKIIFKKAMDRNASSIIMIHNHPSGNIKPSEQDVRLTKRLREFGNLIDLPVLDHLIFTDNGYFSFSDEGQL